MKREFALRKMDAEASEPVRYFLDLKDDFLIVNEIIGREINIKHVGYECKSCGSDEPVYAHGFCKKCYFESPYAGSWIIHPEKSTAHLGIADRDLSVEKAMQLQPHYVYLARTSQVKVGVTRVAQTPNRWIDQGADEALAFMEVPNRYLAGEAEVALKQHISDKTNWRAMLKPNGGGEDLTKILQELKRHLPGNLLPYLLPEPLHFAFVYPVEKFPATLKQLKLNLNEFSGKLAGIKGQYWIFEDGTVWNVRNHESYVIEMEVL